MLIPPIEDQIAACDIDAINAVLGEMPFPPYPYQYAVYDVTAQAIKHYKGPFVVKASVSAGKTVMISMIAKRIMQMTIAGHQAQALVIARQAEIVEQDHKEMRNFAVPNSVYCAGLGLKSSFYPVVTGSVGTVVNALTDKLADFAPLFLLIDECHQVNVDDLIASELAGEETIEDMKEAGRADYTIIIRELQRRALAKYGTKLRIIGYTGTDYRSTQPIINPDYSTPGFWRAAVCDISMDYLEKVGSIVPTTFGISKLKYNLEQFKAIGGEGCAEFSGADMDAMQEAIEAQNTLTAQIMQEVYELTLDRNGVLVTCAGVEHCKQAARALPPGVSYAIITDDTNARQRRKILKDANHGKIKFIFQIGCLTTGVNVPFWDTSVILRKIGSLTLLVQLLGRGVRILKDFHHDLGFVKEDHLVLDYGGAMDDLGAMYFNPILEAYTYSRDKENAETKHCPHGHENGKHARRCIWEDPHTGARCGHWFISRTCGVKKDHAGRVLSEGCGAKNDVAARFCSVCGDTLIDPNEALSNKHYTVDDYCKVVSFEVEPARGDGAIGFKYMLEQDGTQFKAWEIFHPGSKSPQARKAWLHHGILKHCVDPEGIKALKKAHTALDVMDAAAYILPPIKVTHRKRGGKDVITRKVFFEDLE